MTIFTKIATATAAVAITAGALTGAAGTASAQTPDAYFRKAHDVTFYVDFTLHQQKPTVVNRHFINGYMWPIDQGTNWLIEGSVWGAHAGQTYGFAQFEVNEKDSSGTLLVNMDAEICVDGAFTCVKPGVNVEVGPNQVRSFYVMAKSASGATSTEYVEITNIIK